MGGSTAKTAESTSERAASDGADTSEAARDGSVAPRLIAGRPVAPDVSGGRGPAMSARMKTYFDRIRADVDHCYVVAKEARQKGLDPSLEVEILPAEDLAARVEAQVGVPGVAEDIRKVSKEIGNRELVSLEIARRVAGGQYEKYSPTEAVDKAVRTGLSILTEGVLVAPLEGIAEVKIGDNDDGTRYVDLYFAGPIRAAGGTAQAMSVLIADVVRRELGIGRYRVTSAELERYKEEVPAYKQAANLQYTPGPKEIEAIVNNCPVCINGEGTERVEITGNRDLPRVETNQIRGGAMLVLCEGMCLKAPKLQKHVAKLGLEGWDFLDLLVSKKDDNKEEAEEEKDPDALPEIPASTKYIRDIIAGRPVFGYPKRAGGFRLRYGRARTAGLASSAVHPAVMALVDDFIAIGTQLKIERPGKGTIGSPCSTIDPPSVELRTGDIVRLDTVKDVNGAKPFIHAILDLGELLMPFGEFSENNHILARSPWVNEWFEGEVEAHVADHGWPDDLPRAASVVRRDRMETLDPHEAYRVAEATGLPLAPSETLFWHDVTQDELRLLSDHIAKHVKDDAGHWADAAPGRPVEAGHPDPRPAGKTLFLSADEAVKEVLRKLVLHHRDLGDRYEVTRHAYTFLRSLGFDVVDDQVVETPRRALLGALPEDLDEHEPVVDLAARLSGVKQLPRGPFRIGARMGRPEKADARKMKPPPHVLFPLGTAGGSQRLVGDAAFVGKIKVEVGKRRCTQCSAFTYRSFCDMCRGHTVEASEEPEEVELDLKDELKRAQESLGERRLPKQIKGVVGMMSAHKTPEPLEKGILRAKHGVYTFKDGTVRFDMTDGPLTHFRPNEVAVPVERLKELGYTHDWQGRPLERDDQMVELFVQDLVVPNACGDYLLACAKYVDELMVKFYGMEPFYKAETRDDLVGHILGGLAPHTSGAIASRIVGFTPSQVGWGHPYFHAGKRRNCDGDEDAVFLLMDGLLNFSKSYVPDRRGGLMDLPLVLTTRLDPNEIDKEAHNVDTLDRYPLAFYRSTTRHVHPKEVEEMMGMVGERVGTPAQYEGFGFTHDTPDISEGVLVSAYKIIPDMMAKLVAQLDLASRIRAVDMKDVASRVIGSHFMPDLIGNLKAFSKQKVRCPACNAKYRRFPLKGSCLTPNCKGKLTLTVHEGSVRKYLQPAKDISRKYSISHYTYQRILLAEKSIESLFNNDKVKKAKLTDFLAPDEPSE